jgi:hypothetical protein
MAPQTYTYSYTRTEAVVDQVDIFLRYAGIHEANRGTLLIGVNNKWLAAIGVYLEENGRRVLEAEISINWSLHSDNAELTIDTDLPGWESGGAPEVIVFGRRFGQEAQRRGSTPGYWGLFTGEIRANPSQHRLLCEKVGLAYGQSPPAWKSEPHSRSLSLQDLAEVGVALREAK